jgi:NAD(P)-dependent dehydrogenase (short-subunit alcohol dehydrogenase family)
VLSEAEEIQPAEVRLLLQAIHERYGYDFRGYSPESMARRLQAVLASSGMRHLGEVQYRVLRDPRFFQSLLRYFTVQVSELFRDPEFFLVFRRRVVPILRTYPQIKLWHAGCASGEEAYTTAVILLEEGLLERAQTYATDIDETAVEQAKEGVYREADIASFVAIVGCSVPQDAYTASKGAVLSLTRSLAVQFGPKGIRTNAICPGPVETPLLMDWLVKDEEAKRIRLARNPTGRFGKPEEIVHMAVYLASDESRWTNGASLVVDGGITVNYF